MRPESNNLEEGLVADQSQPVAGNQTSAFVYVVTKIFPLLATGVFASTTDLKKPESIALSTAMVSSTALPLLSDILKLSGRLPQLLETIAGFCLFAGVGMMDQGAIKEDNQSARSYISLTAVGCFSLFAAISTVYNSLKLGGCIEGRKPGVELTSASFGLVGSLLFLVGNTLGLLAQQEAGKPVDAAARMIGVASCFTLSTAFHTVLAGRAVCAKKSEDNVLLNDEDQSESVSNYSVGVDVRKFEQEGRVIMMEEERRSPERLNVPPATPVSPRRQASVVPSDDDLSGHYDPSFLSPRL